MCAIKYVGTVEKLWGLVKEFGRFFRKRELEDGVTESKVAH